MGTSPEFSGIHPAIIIRTLKEKDLYIVIPLTTYTKITWEKTKKHGFGIRIKETNSIAKIDKYKVIHKNQIRNKWIDKNTGKPIIINSESFKSLNIKFLKYNRLTGIVAEKEYDKYIAILEKFDTDFSAIVTAKTNAEYEGLFEIQTDSDTQTIYRCKKSLINMISMADVHLIVKKYLDTNNINIRDNCLIINYQKPIDKE